MKFAALARSAALVTAVALIPATTASLAQVDGRAGPEFAKVLAVYQRIKASYVEPVEDDVLIRGMIDGMLSSLDPHSGYLDGSDLQRLETMIDGNYSGLGLSVVEEDGAVKVISPFRGSPADKMGIKAGDFITHLDGKFIVGQSLDESVARMRGDLGLDSCETIRREGAPIPLKPLRRWDNGSDVIVAGDAAGVVAPASGEGIYYAMMGGRCVAQAADAFLATGQPAALRQARKAFMREHGKVFWILGMMQHFWYSSDKRRERFVTMCADRDVQQLTWEAYMNKRLVRAKPVAHARIFLKDCAHLLGLRAAA